MRLDLDAVTVELAGRRIVTEVSLAADGEVLGLVGPNGSGKTTVLRTVYRMLTPVGGVVRVGGDDVTRLSRREGARRTAAMVQEGGAEIPFTVAELVATGLTARAGVLGPPAATAAAEVAEALDRVGMTAFAARLVATLSGGELQRAHLARALAQRPSVLVLDEPTNHLDVRHQLDLLTLVRGCAVTTLVTLHDLNLATAFCDRLAVLCGGRVVASGTPDAVLTPGLLRDVFDVEAVCLVNPLTGRSHLAFGPAADVPTGTS
jgi:iron complex transport system ATP-binding protein